MIKGLSPEHAGLKGVAGRTIKLLREEAGRRWKNSKA